MSPSFTGFRREKWTKAEGLTWKNQNRRREKEEEQEEEGENEKEFGGREMCSY